MRREIACCILLLTATTLSAQNNIVKELQSRESGGKIQIIQPAAIDTLIGKNHASQNIIIKDNKQYFAAKGYRIQIYSGNNQRFSKNESAVKEREILEQEPNLACYITFKSPFWRLRVGDYPSREQAEQMLRNLKIRFPKLSKEMYVVKDDILLPHNSVLDFKQTAPLD